jgi:hypothetical protein
MEKRRPHRSHETINANMGLYDAYMADGDDRFELKNSPHIRGRRIFETASNIGLAPSPARSGKPNISSSLLHACNSKQRAIFPSLFWNTTGHSYYGLVEMRHIKS